MKRGQALLPVPDAFPFRGAETVWRSRSIWFSRCFVVSLSIGFRKLWHEPVFIDTRQTFWFVGLDLNSREQEPVEFVGAAGGVGLEVDGASHSGVVG